MSKESESTWAPVLYMRDGRSGRGTKKVYPPTNVVYFIRGGRALKIGTTDQIVRRFEALQAQSPIRLALVGLIHGGEHVERWCQFHCVEFRTHYEWFRWNGWTDAFVRWVLAHGDLAADRLCPDQARQDHVSMVPGRPRAMRCDVPQLPQMKFHRDADAQRSYRARAARLVAPLGACSCELCAAQPWKCWS